MLAIEKLAGIKAVAQGGYPQAERCRISVGHPDSMRSDPDVVAALSISGNFRLEPCSHGDFLGAILGAGITREKVGDILLQVLVDPELVDYLTSTLEKVGKVGVSCTQIPLLAIEYEPPRTKSFKTVESSLRVDAVASAGFKISRTKLGSMISSGDVRVNWSLVSKSGATLKAGDVVSVSGMGRLKFTLMEQFFWCLRGIPPVQVFENMLDLALYCVCNWGNRDYEERQICRSVDSIFVGP
uniref:RNA-binding S4 domain-containing protein n=1 Tax=Triticum aestivum TaxID=4565 RepID=A0A3B6FSR8_WHEAT